MAASKFLKQLLKSAAMGSGAGALVGAATAPEGERTKGALAGGFTGGALGMGAHSALGLLKDVGRGLHFLASDPKDKKAIRKLSLEDLSDVLKKDELSTTDIRDKLAKLRTTDPSLPPMIANVGGESTRGAAERAVTLPGPARNAAVKTMSGRLAGLKPRIEGAIGSNLTPSTDASGELTRLQALKKADSDAQYGAARAAFPHLDSPELQKLAPVLKDFGAFDMANQAAKADLEPPIDPASMGLKEWDLVKRGLDAHIKILERKDGNDFMAGKLKGLKSRLTTELDALTPDPSGVGSMYAAARNRFHELSTTADAIEAGRGIVSTKAGPGYDDVLDNYSKLSPADQEAFRVGVGRGILDQANAGKEGVGMIRNILNTKGDRLAPLFKTPAQWDSFKNTLEYNLHDAELGNTTLGNSATARREGGAEAHDVGSVAGDLSTLTSSKTPTQGAMAIVMRRIHNTDPAEVKQLTANDLVKTLMNPDHAQNLRAMDELDRHLARAHLKDTVYRGLQLGTAGVVGAGAGAVAGMDLGQMTNADGSPTGPPDPNAAPPDGYAQGGPVRAPEAPLRLFQDYDPRELTGVTADDAERAYALWDPKVAQTRGMFPAEDYHPTEHGSDPELEGYLAHQQAYTDEHGSTSHREPALRAPERGLPGTLQDLAVGDLQDFLFPTRARGQSYADAYGGENHQDLGEILGDTGSAAMDLGLVGGPRTLKLAKRLSPLAMGAVLASFGGGEPSPGFQRAGPVPDEPAHKEARVPWRKVANAYEGP